MIHANLMKAGEVVGWSVSALRSLRVPSAAAAGAAPPALCVPPTPSSHYLPALASTALPPSPRPHAC